jgi:hypothetical protein
LGINVYCKSKHNFSVGITTKNFVAKVKEKKMAKKDMWGMLAGLLAFGMALVGCDNGTTNDGDDGGISGGNSVFIKVINNNAHSISFVNFFEEDAGIGVGEYVRNASETGTGIAHGTEYRFEITIEKLKTHGAWDAFLAGKDVEISIGYYEYFEFPSYGGCVMATIKNAKLAAGKTTIVGLLAIS